MMIKDRHQFNQDSDLPLEIARKTRSIFSTHYARKFKNKDPNHPLTVISSISLVDQKTKDFQVVSVGFGTKSLPCQVAKEHSHRVIKDMHGEILARRGFSKFIKSHFPGPKESNQYFEWVERKGKHRLRETLHVVLYSSENFCGDCMVNGANEMFSGAKPLKYYALPVIPQDKFVRDCLRTKPGRLDLPVRKRSLSLSCSDKVGLWNILGVQGRRLFNKVMPIYFSDIIVEVHPGQEKDRLQQGLDLMGRISRIRGMSGSTVRRKVFKIVIDGQQRNITNQFKCKTPHLHPLPKIVHENQEKGRKRLEVCGIICGNEVSWLNGRTGLPEGVNINQQAHKPSPFCSQTVYEGHQSNMEEEFKYIAVKDRIKRLFGEWTDDYKDQHGTGPC